jgi:transcriptional regulator with XRE-family HTH domain
MDKSHEEENKMINNENVEYYDSGFPKVMNRGKYDMQVNSRLKEARSRRGYSLAKVKNLLALQGTPTGRSTIQGYEADEENINHRYPSLHMLLQLSKLYECSMDYIFGVSDIFEPPTNDLRHFLLNNCEALNWNGKEINKEEIAMICVKIEQIMAL